MRLQVCLELAPEGRPPSPTAVNGGSELHPALGEVLDGAASECARGGAGSYAARPPGGLHGLAPVASPGPALGGPLPAAAAAQLDRLLGADLHAAVRGAAPAAAGGGVPSAALLDGASPDSSSAASQLGEPGQAEGGSPGATGSPGGASGLGAPHADAALASPPRLPPRPSGAASAPLPSQAGARAQAAAPGQAAGAAGAARAARAGFCVAVECALNLRLPPARATPRPAADAGGYATCDFVWPPSGKRVATPAAPLALRASLDAGAEALAGFAGEPGPARGAARWGFAHSLPAPAAGARLHGALELRVWLQQGHAGRPPTALESSERQEEGKRGVSPAAGAADGGRRRELAEPGLTEAVGGEPRPGSGEGLGGATLLGAARVDLALVGALGQLRGWYNVVGPGCAGAGSERAACSACVRVSGEATCCDVPRVLCDASDAAACGAVLTSGRALPAVTPAAWQTCPGLPAGRPAGQLRMHL